MKVFARSAVRVPRGVAVFVFFVACQIACAGEGKLAVVATLFPQYDFARIIAGEHAEVALLLTPGTEAHSFEPTPSAMKKIAAADVFIFTGEYMEPWAKRLVDSAGTGGGVAVVDASRGIPLMRGDGDHDEHEHDHAPADAHIHEYDPHIWLDPVFAAAMAETIAAGLAEADPVHAADYRSRGEKLKNDLLALHRDFEAIVAAAPRRELVFGERFAFAYFFHRYGLEEIGAYKSCAPGAEPGLKAVIGVIEYVKANKVKYIYLEAMSTSRISSVIQQETGVEILSVDSLHNPSPEARQSGVTYLDLMAKNMAAFARGLE